MPVRTVQPMAPDDELGAEVHHLGEWLRDERTAQAAADRARRHWLDQQAAAGATLAGVLVDLAEGHRPVVVHTRGGRVWRGTVEGVGHDVVALRTDGAARVLLSLDAIASLRPEVGVAASGDRPAPIDLTLAGALALAVADRPRVQLGCGAAEPVAGTLEEVGVHLAAVRTEGGAVVHVALQSIDAALLR